MYYVYMLKNESGKLYIGISDNPERRLSEHNTDRGAVFTKGRDFSIVFLEEYTSMSDARQRENQLKKWSRKKKDFLIKRYADGLQTKLPKKK